LDEKFTAGLFLCGCKQGISIPIVVGYVRLKQNWPEADGYGNECWPVNLLGFGPFVSPVII
jgi:hypothetical protein